MRPDLVPKVWLLWILLTVSGLSLECADLPAIACPTPYPFQYADADLICLTHCQTDGVGDYGHLETIHNLLKKNGFKVISIALIVGSDRSKSDYKKYGSEREPNDIIKIISDNPSDLTGLIRGGYPDLVDAMGHLPIFFVSHPLANDIMRNLLKPLLKKNYKPITYVSELVGNCFNCDLSERKFDECTHFSSCMGVGPVYKNLTTHSVTTNWTESKFGPFLGFPFNWDLIETTANSSLVERRKQMLPKLEDQSLYNSLVGTNMEEFLLNHSIFFGYFQRIHAYIHDSQIVSRSLFILTAVSLTKYTNKTTLNFFVGSFSSEAFISDYEDFLVSKQRVKYIEIYTKQGATGKYIVSKITLPKSESSSFQTMNETIVWKKLRFFITYLSYKDLSTLYQVIDGPVGASDDNTFITALSYSERAILNDTGYSFPPILFSQYPRIKSLIFQERIPEWLEKMKSERGLDSEKVIGHLRFDTRDFSVFESNFSGIINLVSSMKDQGFLSQYGNFLKLLHEEYNFEDHLLNVVSDAISYHKARFQIKKD